MRLRVAFMPRKPESFRLTQDRDDYRDLAPDAEMRGHQCKESQDWDGIATKRLSSTPGRIASTGGGRMNSAARAGGMASAS